MRVVLVNWARIWDGATHGGGVNGYCQALALELVARGHEVISLFGGTSFVPDDAGRIGPCRVRRHEDWLGIAAAEVVNSPVIAPSLLQFRDPDGERSSPGLESAVESFLRELRADVVHFHNIEGFSAGCIDAARRAGAGVIYSVHNYHTICPQVYLMRGHRVPCSDFAGGAACADCIATPDPGAEKARRAAEYARAHRPAAPTVSGRAPRVRELTREILRLVRHPRKPTASPPAPVPWPAHEPGGWIADGRLVPLSISAREERGKARFIQAEAAARDAITPEAPEWAPLPNTPPRDSPPVNAYGHRRRAMVEALGRCDRVLAVSSFVRDTLVAMGVPPAVVETRSIGTRIGRVVERHRELAFAPPPHDPANPRPLRLVFMGYNNWYKGLPMLADSLELLTPEYLRRIHLQVNALDGQSIEWRFRRLEPRLAGLAYYHAYEQPDIPWICGGKDMGLVTSVWWDNAPQTVFEFQACGLPVLAARAGGIPDFVRDGVDGLLFRANDRYDLARTLARVARDPSICDRLRAGVTPPKDIGTHAREMEAIYADARRARGGAT